MTGHINLVISGTVVSGKDFLNKEDSLTKAQELNELAQNKMGAKHWKLEMVIKDSNVNIKYK